MMIEIVIFFKTICSQIQRSYFQTHFLNSFLLRNAWNGQVLLFRNFVIETCFHFLVKAQNRLEIIAKFDVMNRIPMLQRQKGEKNVM